MWMVLFIMLVGTVSRLLLNSGNSRVRNYIYKLLQYWMRNNVKIKGVSNTQNIQKLPMLKRKWTSDQRSESLRSQLLEKLPLSNEGP